MVILILTTGLSTDGGDNIRGFVNFGMSRVPIVITMEKFYLVIEPRIFLHFLVA